MRYYDSSSRDPDQALGSWLRSNVVDDDSVASFRAQSGFFDAGPLELLGPVLQRLGRLGGPITILVGSNDGITRREDLIELIESVGPDRPALHLGVVSFDIGFFHPKVVHLTRNDGSAAAYVGSANLTANGVRGSHIEAALGIDTRDGDPEEVIAAIGRSIDKWFIDSPEGMYHLRSIDDIEVLAESGVIGVPAPEPSPRLPATPAARARPRLVLSPLFDIPGYAPAPRTTDREQRRRVPMPTEPEIVPEATWTKRLTTSDAQRKPTGNQRGSITLVRAGLQIDPQTYFRRDFFGAVRWTTEETRTGLPRERTDVTMAVSILGDDLGEKVIPITYAANREAAQNNYTTLLHIGPMQEEFARRDLSGRQITLSRDVEGRFRLRID